MDDTAEKPKCTICGEPMPPGEEMFKFHGYSGNCPKLPLKNKFREELEATINRASRENGSNTPDFILAEYLDDCLAAFDKASRAREKWYGKELKI